MSRPSFVLRLALREARSGVRRIGLYMSCIAFGVMGLVAVHSFREDLSRAVDDQAEILLGADVRLSSDDPFPPRLDQVLDSIGETGTPVARVSSLASMVSAPASGTVRLMQVRGVEGPFPFYGVIATRPEGLWGRHLQSGVAIADEAVLTQLGVEIGDTLVIGAQTFSLVAVASNLPTDLGFQSALGPRIYISREALGETGLLTFGSLASHEAYLGLPSRRRRAAFRERYRGDLREAGVRFTTADAEARDLTRAVEFLGRYLGLVGLSALLLGGVGVGSAIHVFVKEKLTGVAVLRCLGARQWRVFWAYLLQSGALGLGGALLGAIGGLAVQRLLPLLLEDALPVSITPRLSLPAVGIGVGIGVTVAMLFALVPLLSLRNVPPLRALRRDVDVDRRRFDAAKLGAYVALALGVLAVSVVQTEDFGEGIAFGVALILVAAMLWATGTGVIRLARRFFPSRARYPIRQGVANLHRPQNQTVAVTFALGAGVYVVATILSVQSALLAEFSLDFDEGRPNLLLFDVQRDQLDGVLALLPEAARERAAVDPIVSGRIAGIGGRSVEDLRGDTTGPRPRGWAVRREYRNTYRPHLTASERLVRGEWWTDVSTPATPESPDSAGTAVLGSPERPARISLATDVIRELGVDLEDRITWNIGGRRIESVVTSVREVDWEQLGTNFFVVFEPGVLEEAPQMTVLLTRIDEDLTRASFQRDLVGAFPNVSALDVTRVQEAVEGILGTAQKAVRFLAAVLAGAGLLVLLGSLGASRVQRMRESALLRTLGARRSQLLSVFVTECAALGALAGLSGLLLALATSWLLVTRIFELSFVWAPASLIGIWFTVTGLTVLLGLLGVRPILERHPLPILREAPQG